MPSPPARASIIDRFAAIVSTNGARAALRFESTALSYDELDRLSNRIANGLAAAGVGPGHRVALAIDRSADAIAAMLGVLKRGAAFVPLDPASPAAYRARILGTAKATCVLTHAAWPHHESFGESPVLFIDDAAWLASQLETSPDIATAPDDAAYVMFTSGSTGEPKGVVAAHRGVTRLVIESDFMEIRADDVFLQLAPLSFDASTLEIWGPLLNGATLAIMPAGPAGTSEIAQALREFKVTVMWLTAGLFHLMVDHQPDALADLRCLLAGGDVLLPNYTARAARLLKRGRVINGYGPTENTTFSTCHTIDPDDPPTSDVPIGRVIKGSTVHILDGDLKPADDGELYVGGLGLALAYLDDPVSTAKSFIPWPDHLDDSALADGAPRLLYRTGDLVHRDSDGVLHFAGRSDDQVKISGHRVELAGVRQALVEAADGSPSEVVLRQTEGRKELCGFVAMAKPDWNESALRQRLAAILPPAAIPGRLIRLDRLPLGLTGKTDRKALAALAEQKTNASTPSAAGDAAQRIAAIWARRLGRETVPQNINFFDLGGSSLDLVAIHAALDDAFPGAFALTDLFAYPTVAAQAAKLSKGARSVTSGRDNASARNGAIAIIGLAGRFPGAASPKEFWRNLVDGVDSITRFGREDVEDALGRTLKDDPRYVPARGMLKDVENFDADFFGFMPREAALADPQQRLFLEVAWEAFEDAGYDPKATEGAVGVFAGASIDTYLINNVLSHDEARRKFTGAYQTGEFQTLTGNGSDFLATRIAYKLDLRGPAMTVQSACSTSLLAVAQACASLREGGCDMALAGGVSVTVPQLRGYMHLEGGMVSPDGHCRPFDADAAGTVFGNGAGVVLLKRLDDALADGDHIYATVLGAGVTNDGAAKVGYAAPGVRGQTEAIQRAHVAAGVAPDSISYIECHGTATPLGDPIEFAALTEAFKDATDRQGFCALGTAKANVGHLDVAAGVTGLIKAALSLEHKALPGLLNWKRPNPAIDLDGSPFRIQQTYGEWESEGPRRAGVSAFGLGGTNVHLVLEEAPACAQLDSSPAQPELILLSARSTAALAAQRESLAVHAETEPAALADIAYSLRHGRHAFRHRTALIATSAADLARKLRANDGMSADADPERVTTAAFLFPGQGSQHAGMGSGLYHRFPAYRAALDACAEVLQPVLDVDLRRYMLAERNDEAASELLRETRLAQPALFASSWALAKLWQSLGVSPVAMIGHSVGELVAASLAGVMSFEEGLRFVAARGAAMQSMPGGSMLAVRANAARVAEMLPADLDIAAINGASSCVVAGPDGAVDEFSAVLAAQDIACRKLRTSHAFHSQMMEPAVANLHDLAAHMSLKAPSIPIVSTLTGDWMTAAQATDPNYWASHVRVPVRFADALTTLTSLDQPLHALMEVGASRVLSSLARQVRPANAARVIVASLADPADDIADDVALLDAAGRLWGHGFDIDWRGLNETGRRVPLPTYAFQRRRHWIEPADTNTAAAVSATSVATAQTVQIPEEIVPMPDAAISAGAPDLGEALDSAVRELLEEVSGSELTGTDTAANFLELGFDSLSLTQIIQAVRGRFGVEIAFRRLSKDIDSPAKLAQHIRANAAASVLEALAPQPIVAITTAAPAPVIPPTLNAPSMPIAAGSDALQHLMREQLATFQNLAQAQLAMLGGAGAIQPVAAPRAAAAAPVAPPLATKAQPSVTPAAAPAPAEPEKAHGPYKPFETNRLNLTDTQRDFVAGLVARNTARTPGSKRVAEEHRKVLADPRVAAGYRLDWKEMVYPLATTRSSGSKIFDVDGNAYIDLLNGFGPTAFGHAPDFVKDALSAQIENGFEIGPMTPLAGEAAELVRELTGNERVTFCNTGSEAVMAAMRIARTVTGRMKIATFSGDYHGQFDEVLVKGFMRNGKPVVSPIAPGIPRESVANMVLLEHNSPDSLAWLRANAHELAAVLVEPVQSRHPGADTKAFLHELRKITQDSGAAFILDEIVTGFRIHPGGAQAVFDLRADLVTYGKVLGGGMPIGVLAGIPRFMDALDGGAWTYGDESGPSVGVTFFAGTFVRHPLSLAACIAVLRHLKAEGPALHARLNERANALVARLNAVLAEAGAPTKVENFGSVMYFKFPPENRFGGLFWYLLRERGVHHQESFPAFLTTAHDDADLDRVVEAFAYAANALRDAGCFGDATATKASLAPPVAAALASSRTAIAPPKPIEPFSAPLSEPQMEIWLSAQSGDAASCAYNESISVNLTGPLDRAALFEAISQVFDRHDILRAHFAADGSEMIVAPDVTVQPIEYDWSSVDASERGKLLKALLNDDARTPIDLTSSPTSRLRFVKLGDLEHVLIFTAHHIVCDGWSLNIIVNELAEIYSSIKEQRASALTPPSSFAERARQGIDSDAEAEAYWLERFADRPAPIDLPTDRLRPKLKSYEGATHTAYIDADLYKAVKKAGAKQGFTLFVTLLGAFQILMGRLAGKNEVVVDVPMAGQSLDNDESTPVVGHSVNFLPLRCGWEDQTSAADFLKSVKQTVLDARDNQRCTLGTIVRKLKLRRETNRLPLTDFQFNLERLSQPGAFGDCKATVSSNPKSHVNFDMFFNIAEYDRGLRLDIDYCTDLFDEATIEQWVEHYATILKAIVDDTAERVVSLPLLSAEQRNAILLEPNATATPFPDNKTFADLFEERWRSTADRIAVACQAQQWTYRELAERVDAIAALLLAYLPSAGSRVGVFVERSCDLPATLLAIAKTGNTFVPLEPHLPALVLDQIIKRSEMHAILGDGRNDLLTNVPVLDLSSLTRARPTVPNATNVTPTAPAYVIFTSGSTGVPKGVEVSHRALTNLLNAMAVRPGLAADDTLIAVTTVSFDISVLELLLPLIVGARLVIASFEEARDGFELLDLIQGENATALQATPTSWRMLADAGFKAPSGFKMLCGGEALTPALAARLLEGHGELWNLYGPTETTIWSSTEKIENLDREISIGRPIANTQFYVVDKHDQPVVPGGVGELVICGTGVANRYIADPALTSSKFSHGFLGKAGQVGYRTGDLARVTRDGRFYLLGRSDHQIKLNGYRIELGAIEAALMAIRGISQAVVTLREESEGLPILAAYYTTERNIPAPEPEIIEVTLKTVLPEYMVPKHYMVLSALPLTTSGKVDRKALPTLRDGAITRNARATYAPLSSPWQKTLGNIWSEVLEIKSIGAYDDILDLGADSIQLFQIVARARRAGLTLAVKDLLLHRNITELAKAFDIAAPDAAQPTAQALPSLSQFRRSPRS